MSLTVYDPEQNCQVLNPDEFTPVINAFHPDYMKTYHPDFMRDFRTVEANQADRKAKEPRKHVATKLVKKKKPNPTHINSKREQGKTIDEVRAELDARKKAMLEPREFIVFSKAGTANVTPKGKKHAT
jgi:hypothetical protein